MLSFFLAPLALTFVVALFSDGYQGLYLDSLVFFGRLVPPEDDWLLVRDAQREAGRRKWSEGSGS